MGIESLLQQNDQSAGLAGIDRLARNAMFPQSQMDKIQYAVPSQLPTSAETIRSDYDEPSNAYTGLPVQPFAKGGLAGLRFYDGGTPEEKNAIVADLYQKILGRTAGEGEASQWANYLNDEAGTLDLARRLSQSEEGKAYAKANASDQYSNIAAISQKDSPFAGTDTPYAKMEYVGPAFATNDTDTVGHQFKDQQGGIITVDSAGNPIKYAPGSAWYDEQLSKNPAALRGTDYRNQTYLAAGPLDKTYKFNGVDVPIEAAEYQVDPTTGQFVKGPTGENKAVEWRPKGYNMWDDWAAPAAVIAVPLAMSYAAPYLAGEAAVTGAGTLGAGEALGAGTAGDVFAGYSATGSAAGTAGTTVPAGYGALGAGATATGAETLAPEIIKDTAGYESLIDFVANEPMESGLLNPATGGGITAKQAMAAKMGLDMLSSGLGGNQQTSGGGVYSPSVAAPTTVPTINRQGVTGYYGAAEAPDYRTVGFKPYLSRIRGVPGEETFAAGGIAALGSYSDGGQLLRGPGDGMSDNIPATISDKQPARLADGEFVVPADVVSHLGNGSTDAGAKQLYKMMDKIRKARTGTKKQGKQINPSKFLP